MPKPGDLLIGRYRILERLGSGGTATVHRARDERLDRDVAVKVLLPNLADDAPTAARFEREARSLAASSHPGVVAVFDVDAGDPATGREPFFVMELCRGGSLADRLAGGRRMAPDDLVPILVTIADGLADLHRRGIVHRDIKPQNILFGDDRAKLADFGLALSDHEGRLSDLTSPGIAVGTMAYLAPEVVAGQRATAAADVYGLGVVAFTGLTGRPPRPATSIALLAAASRSAAPTVSAVSPDLGPAFDGILGAALVADPDGRPDALSFASGLAAALGRWTRDGGPARRSIVGIPSNVPVGVAPRARAGDPAFDEDAITSLGVPIGATESLPLDAAAGRGAVPRSRPTGAGRATTWLGRATVVAAFVVAVLLALVALTRLTPSAAPAGRTAAPSTSRSSSPSPSVSPSVSPSASAARPSPTPDPALASLTAMDAAISAARGGQDGLKGKEARDLQDQVAAIRQALDGGDRQAALDAARELDQRVADVADHLGNDQADALRAASRDLVRALGG